MMIQKPCNHQGAYIFNFVLISKNKTIVEEAQSMLRQCNSRARYPTCRRRMATAYVRHRRGRGGGGDKIGESDPDTGSNIGDEANNRALEDADEYEGDNAVNDTNVHVHVVFVASNASDPPVQVMAEMSEYDPAFSSVDLHGDVPSLVPVEPDA